MRKLFFLLTLLIPRALYAADGSELWLRYKPVDAEVAQRRTIRLQVNNEIAQLAKKELDSYWSGSPVELRLDRSVKRLKEGYQIKRRGSDLLVTAAKPVGLLYAAYHLLRLQEVGADVQNIDIEEVPDFDIRILNHWDNLDGTVERGYAGYSLWKWDDLPKKISPRYERYARANASIGINATVLNNVNASPQILTPDYLEKVKALADVFRKYGIRVYLSANFSSPKVLGGLADSDPLRKEVKAWWIAKVDEIYKHIPDFGGFLVKANSEGQPGPQDYGRTHADGANMLADALKPYGGTVMWRAFVYNPTQEDRAKQAYQEFVPLDGKFRENVIIQIKNGPIDFQPREPFTPVFGAMDKTQQMVEFQITQEYLGFSNHLVYLAPLFKETLDAETFSRGPGSTVARITTSSAGGSKKTAISAVSNIGEDDSWTGHHFGQANWYAFGRLAWNHQLTSEDIAEEWICQTFTGATAFREPVRQMMMDSREAVVDYMMPLGLHHIFAFDHHYGPEPWGDMEGGRPDWMPWYYHNADTTGIGFNRTKSGSNAVSQYKEPLQTAYGNLTTCPENLLLYFHHVSWSHTMKSGRSLWDELCFRYDRGVKEVREFQKTWDRLESYVDQQRFEEVQSKLKIQTRDAVWWKDACLLYFQIFAKMPIPYELERPIHELDELKKIKLDMKHHN
ncbi:alpha-glucuronidase [Sphingobacterium corticibacterium]|uniref:Alpha-glucuronidase n=1 Tax=Sphingobacterium corticibacterium TaxID=2484746 RepID=A0A4Q6XS07_9SPHI|nr:alpha-glucuronidase [Sphingobacterium corticibacterium]RZF59307.1 alpha-glucuronidase [Sphingobacterium corticibacterium]